LISAVAFGVYVEIHYIKHWIIVSPEIQC